MRRLPIVLCLLSIALSSFARAEEPKEWVAKNLDGLVKLYRHFHEHPELSFQEKETSSRVAEELKGAGFDVTANVGGYGVVAVLKNGPGKTLLLRTDLDALPVTEQTGLVYASHSKGKLPAGETDVMHACGHDIHMTNLIGTARYLGSHKDRWSGTLVLIGQPAEERVSGAQAMLKDGLFKRFPKPDFALAVHVDSALPTGKLGYCPGAAYAYVDNIDIVIHGKGSHGSRPEKSIDPIVIAARLVLDLQTIVSREVDPRQPAVVTVGSIHGGTQYNIIGDTCHLQLTVRSYKDEVRKQLVDAIKRKTEAAAASAGAPEPELKIADGTPALINSEKLGDRLMPALRKELGDENLVRSEPTMGAEDFGLYGRIGDIPIVMYHLGSIDPQRLARFAQLKQDPPSLHSGLYYPEPEQTLTTGIRTLTAATMELLKPAK